MNKALMNILEEVREIVFEVLKAETASVYLFGSWARETPGPASDIDVAINPKTPLPPPGLLARLRELLEESNIPYRVEIVDLSLSSASFRERVLREGIPWSG